MSCPDEDLINAFVEGRLEPDARLEVEQHLDRCRRCHALVAELIRQTEPDQPPARVSPQSREKRSGDRLGRYTILGIVGRGSMGDVYRAYDPELDRTIALKLVRDRSQGHARTLREARALALLTHPNVVSVFDVVEIDDAIVIAMELIEGRDVRRWFAERPRSWREVLSVFNRAGQGLAAAHQAGLVHRDFKPSNVLLGDDERVCVADFGLVRAGEAVPADSDSSNAREAEAETRKLVRHTLTETGSLLGTPAYMAPEQLFGGGATQRSDQFSFAVALWEGLYGERPWAPRTVAELARAYRSQEQPVPSRNDVPESITHALRRALSIEPAQRYATISDLLDALRPPRRRRFAVGVSLAGLALAALAVFAIADKPVPCTGAQRHLDRVWGESVRDRIDGHLSGDSSRIESARSTLFVTSVDRWTHRWAEHQTAICQATRIDGDQSEVVLDLRMACMDRRLNRLDRLLVALLATPIAEVSPAVVDAALESMSKLDRVSPCSDRSDLKRVARLGELDAEGHRLLDAMESARQMIQLGQHQAPADSLVKIGEALNHTDSTELEAEFHLLRGESYEARGNFENADGAYREALKLGMSVGYRDLALRAAQALAFGMVHWQRRFSAGDVFLQTANALSRGLGDVREARTLKTMGASLWAQGRHDEAEDASTAAIQLFAESLGPDHLEVAFSKNNLGLVLMRQGRHLEAEKMMRDALEVAVRALGSHHVRVAGLKDNLGLISTHLGQFEAAERLHREALAMREEIFGAMHPHQAIGFTNLGLAQLRQERYDDAEDSFRAALRVDEATLPESHPLVGVDWMNIGQALEHARGSISAYEPYERALTILERADRGDGDEYLANALASFADVLWQRGSRKRALDAWERAFELCQPGVCDSEIGAHTRFGYARRLWHSARDPERARRLALEALASFSNNHSRYRARKVERWLRQREYHE